MTEWRTAYASVIGTSHSRSDLPCQDAGECRVLNVSDDGHEVLLVAVADGAGSASRSDVGSSLAVRMFLSDFAAIVDADPELEALRREDVVEWLEHLRREIDRLAADAACRSDEFACTFLAAVVGEERAICFQIGDGAIVVDGGEEGGHRTVFWPQHGEFANTTNFVTQDAFEKVLEFEILERRIANLAVFSDGIERLVLEMTAKTVHSPALSPVFDWLSKTEPPIEGEGPSGGLTAFLGSSRVNERTDDDKTLVMAIRGVPSAMADDD